MAISSKIKTIFRGDVPFYQLPREVLRRKRKADRRRVERRNLEQINDGGARLAPRFAALAPDGLLTHFRERHVSFLAFCDLDGDDRLPELQSSLFPDDTACVIGGADKIVRSSRWDLAGFGEREFTGENVWRRDPLGETDWGTEYHTDVVAFQKDGPDIRVLWELNRLGHTMTLARAFAVSQDETYAHTFFSHVESWMLQNPYGRGANWTCAMEVALRSINLLAAFDIFRYAKSCTAERLANILKLFDQHGRYIRDNDEFSYITTSNHYLSDVVGLFWIGTLLPELDHADQWREFGLREMLREMDKQILADGADFEASTGYHKFVAELLLFSFILAKRNGAEVPEKNRDKLRSMLGYIGGILRPDGRLPLIGDADGSQIVPLVKHDSDDAAYLLALGAVMFDEPGFKQPGPLPPEILWIHGESGVEVFASVQGAGASPTSAGFCEAGAYVMRHGDLYLHLNANDCGVNGRGSHGHNDALSIEVSAFGREFIIDPGSYVYNLDREARQLFRSTAYHSTVTVDGMEQNTIETDLPFVMGNEARPTVLLWETGTDLDRVSAQHAGYMRLPRPVCHRRTIEFQKTAKYWLVEDLLDGRGEHEFIFSFHLAPGLSTDKVGDRVWQIAGSETGSLVIVSDGGLGEPVIKAAARSLGYGHKQDSQIIRWTAICPAPLKCRFLLVPVAPGETSETRLALVKGLTQNIGD